MKSIQVVNGAFSKLFQFYYLKKIDYWVIEGGCLAFYKMVSLSFLLII